MAKDQIRLSKEAGADSVKVQIYDTDELFPKDFKYYEDSKRGMFSKDQHRELSAYAKEVGIEWFASPFHIWAVELMEELGAKRYKVASRSVSDYRLLGAIAGTKKPVIMSVGMSTYAEIKKALDILDKGTSDITLLYCVAKYPTEYKDFNMFEMYKLARAFNRPIGLSSHCPSIWPAVKAAALRATVIEQHTTISRELPGCDQAASITYPELAQLVEAVKELEKIA